MSITSFSIRSNLANYDIKLPRRITLITGDSATGKTTMVKLLKESVKQSTIKVHSESQVYFIHDDMSLSQLLNVTNGIIVLDEDELDDFRVISRIADSCVTNNNYFVLMYRTAPSEDINLHFAVMSYNKLVLHDGIYYNVPRFSLSIPTDLNKFDHVVTEDTVGGYYFLKAIFPKVISSGGNGEIVKEVSKLTGNVLVFADLANFGEHYIEFSRLNQDNPNLKPYLVPSYECFEELLLRSNILNKNSEVVQHFKEPWVLANDYKTWEKFYEKFVEDLIVGTAYVAKHKSTFSKCWYSNCGNSKFCNRYKKATCAYPMEGDKLYEIFRGTKYEYIYHLLINSKNV